MPHRPVTGISIGLILIRTCISPSFKLSVHLERKASSTFEKPHCKVKYINIQNNPSFCLNIPFYGEQLVCGASFDPLRV